MPLSSLPGSADRASYRGTYRASYRAFVAACGTAVLATGGLVLAVAYGWLGADVGRSEEFCELTRSPVKQVANSLSNIGFVVAGLAIAVRCGRPGGLGRGTLNRHPRLATAYACLVVLLGPGSAAMHATGTSLGGRLDVLSMHLVAAFALAYALMRLMRAGPAAMAAWFGVILVGLQLTSLRHVDVPVVGGLGNLSFGAALTLAVLLEALLRRRGLELDLRWALAATGCFVVAFAIWVPSHTGGPWCDPGSLLQGHAVWHLLGAAAAWCLFRLYASETPGGAPPLHPR